MMKLVAHMLKDHLEALPHLVRDSTDFLKHIRSLRVSVCFSLVKIDVKEYVMSGSHSMLLDEASKFFTGAERRRFRQALRFILENQFVQLYDSDWVHQVICGSGMGAMCSGEVSDAALYHLAEKSVLSRQYMEQVGVLAYYRFKDDILAILDGPRKDLHKFSQDLCRAVSPFELQIETVSSERAVFLDVEIYRPKNFVGGALDYSVHVKKSSQWTPLSKDSLHHPSVHEAWPRAMISRYHRLCKHSQAAQDHISIFLASLRRAGASQSFLDSLATPSRVRRPKERRDVRSMFLVLPFFPQWLQSGLQGTLARLNAVWGARLGIRIRVSWKLGESHLVTRLKSFNSSIQTDALDWPVVRRIVA